MRIAAGSTDDEFESLNVEWPHALAVAPLSNAKAADEDDEEAGEEEAMQPDAEGGAALAEEGGAGPAGKVSWAESCAWTEVSCIDADPLGFLF